MVVFSPLRGREHVAGELPAHSTAGYQTGHENTVDVIVGEKCQQEALCVIVAGMPNDKGLKSLGQIRFLGQTRQTKDKKASSIHGWNVFRVCLRSRAAWICSLNCKVCFLQDKILAQDR